MVLYINGRKWGEFTTEVNGFSKIDQFTIFNEYNGGTNRYHLKGRLGSAKFYNRVLPLGEIFQDYMYEEGISRYLNPELILDGLVCQLDGNIVTTSEWSNLAIPDNGVLLTGVEESQLKSKYVKFSGNSQGTSKNPITFTGGEHTIIAKVRVSKSDFESSKCVANIGTAGTANMNKGICFAVKSGENYFKDQQWASDGWTKMENSWYDVPAIYVLTFDGTTRKMLRNSILLDGGNNTAVELPENNFCVGAFKYHTTGEYGEYFDGDIYDVLIYNRGLTISEIEKVTSYLQSNRIDITKNLIGEFRGATGSNLDKSPTWIDTNIPENALVLNNLDYNSFSGFYLNRLRLDGINDYISTIDSTVNCLSIALRSLSTTEAISTLLDIQNGLERLTVTLSNTGELSWTNVLGFYINGEEQASTGTYQIDSTKYYTFHLNIVEGQSQISLFKDIADTSLMACEIDSILFYNRILEPLEIRADYLQLVRDMGKEYKIKDKYLILDANKIKKLSVVATSETLNNIPIRYIREYMNGSSANDGSHWYEIMAKKSDGTNVALNKKVTLVGPHSGQVPERLVDGQTAGNYVEMDGTPETFVVIDLVTPTSLDNIHVWHYHSDGRTYRDIKLEVSPDGLKWYTLWDSSVDGEYQETSNGKVHKLNIVTVETIGSVDVLDVGEVAELSEEMFERYGMSKEVTEYMGFARTSLLDDAPKILYHTQEPKEVRLKEIGVPFGELIEMKNVADLSPLYVNHVRNIDITADAGTEKCTLKFAISVDEGVTWKSYVDGSWIDVLKLNAIIIEKGMTLEVINNLTEAQLQAITENVESVKLLWYMQKDVMDSSLSISHIHMDYNTSL